MFFGVFWRFSVFLKFSGVFRCFSGVFNWHFPCFSGAFWCFLVFFGVFTSIFLFFWHFLVFVGIFQLQIDPKHNTKSISRVSAEVPAVA